MEDWYFRYHGFVINQNRIFKSQTFLKMILTKNLFLDVDECADNPCHGDATCNNFPGSFTCTCKSGLSGDGFNCTGNV